MSDLDDTKAVATILRKLNEMPAPASLDELKKNAATLLDTEFGAALPEEAKAFFDLIVEALKLARTALKLADKESAQ